MNDIFLSVIIPCFDEMTNLQKGVLDKVERFLEKKKYKYEIIIVDDGSTDGSVEFLEKFIKENPHFRLIKNSHLGKAGAVTTGMLNARGKYRLFTDMDQATPIEELDKLLPFFNENHDVIIGSRSRRKGAPLTRIIMSKGVIIVRSLLIGLSDIKDTQCGFKIFTQNSADKIFLKIRNIHNGFQKIKGSSVTAGFDVELLYLAKKHGFKVKEVPVEWLYVETRRVNPIKDSIDGFLDLLRIKRNIFRGIYK